MKEFETFFEDGGELSKDQCPTCGYWTDEDSLIEVKDKEYTCNPNDPFGAMDWMEVHKCSNCDTVFEFDECNY